MKVSNILLIITFFLAGCELFPSKFHKCSSLTGWCITSADPEIMYWGLKDNRYKPTKSCCSAEWDMQVRTYKQIKQNIFKFCSVDEKTGKPLTKMSEAEGIKCLEKNGLYRYSKNTSETMNKK